MTSVDGLLSLIDRYAEANRLSPATVSKKLFNDGKRIAAIRAGGDVGTRRLARAINWFAANWPEGADWPAGVERPSPAPSSPEAAE
jgi:hypothetical protein